MSYSLPIIVENNFYQLPKTIKQSEAANDIARELGSEYYLEGNGVQYHHVSDTEWLTFSAKLMQLNPDYAHDVLTINNPIYEEETVPLLIKYLKNPTNKEIERDFLDSIQKATMEFMKSEMISLIEENTSGFENSRDDYDPSFNI